MVFVACTWLGIDNVYFGPFAKSTRIIARTVPSGSTDTGGGGGTGQQADQ